MWCARALRNYPSEATLKTLVSCLRDEAFCVRYHARAALTGMVGSDLGPDAADWASAALPTPQAPKPAKTSWWGRLLGRDEPAPPQAGS